MIDVKKIIRDELAERLEAEWDKFSHECEDDSIKRIIKCRDEMVAYHLCTGNIMSANEIRTLMIKHGLLKEDCSWNQSNVCLTDL